MILEDNIKRYAQACPRKTAIVCGNQQLSYQQLHEAVCQQAKMLRENGYRQGQIVCLRAYSTIDYLITYFALHTIGCVATPLEQTTPDALFENISKTLTDSVPDDIADILYTTGTTGRSKGVMISHRTILADAENLIAGQGFKHETVFVINGPLNHIGSLSKVYPVIMQGGTIILVDGLKDINRFFAAFDYPSDKMATFLVPASIRILIQLSADRLKALADKIDFIETGAAAISQADMETLCRLLPKSRLYNTYASTETGIISTYNYNDGRCLAGCLGKPMPHSQIIITPEGLIACKGDTLMSGYVGDPERTATILRDHTVFTSDLGSIDADGMLHLKGREDDVINVGGFKVSPTEVEDAALAHPDIKDCICIATDHPIMGKALKLLVVMKNGKELQKRPLALFLKERLEAYKIPQLYEQVPAVQRTYNGKLNRKYYQQ